MPSVRSSATSTWRSLLANPSRNTRWRRWGPSVPVATEFRSSWSIPRSYSTNSPAQRCPPPSPTARSSPPTRLRCAESLRICRRSSRCNDLPTTCECMCNCPPARTRPRLGPRRPIEHGSLFARTIRLCRASTCRSRATPTELVDRPSAERRQSLIDHDAVTDRSGEHCVAIGHSPHAHGERITGHHR